MAIVPPPICFPKMRAARSLAPSKAASTKSAAAMRPNEAAPCSTPRGGPRSARARQPRPARARMPCSAPSGHGGVAVLLVRKCSTASTAPKATAMVKMTKAPVSMSGALLPSREQHDHEPGERDGAAVIDPAGFADHKTLGGPADVAGALGHEEKSRRQNDDADQEQRHSHFSLHALYRGSVPPRCAPGPVQSSIPRAAADSSMIYKRNPRASDA